MVGISLNLDSPDIPVVQCVCVCSQQGEFTSVNWQNNWRLRLSVDTGPLQRARTEL